MTLEDEKKTIEPGDDTVAEAEALAAEALRAVEAAKAASARLAEVRASINLLASNRKATVISAPQRLNRNQLKGVSLLLLPLFQPLQLLS